MLVYDSMRVRDDFRESGDNTFWVKESDYNELSHKLESARVERDNARDQRNKLRAALEELAYEYQYNVDKGKPWQRARSALKATEEG